MVKTCTFGAAWTSWHIPISSGHNRLNVWCWSHKQICVCSCMFRNLKCLDQRCSVTVCTKYDRPKKAMTAPSNSPAWVSLQLHPLRARKISQNIHVLKDGAKPNFEASLDHFMSIPSCRFFWQCLLKPQHKNDFKKWNEIEKHQKVHDRQFAQQCPLRCKLSIPKQHLGQDIRGALDPFHQNSETEMAIDIVDCHILSLSCLWTIRVLMASDHEQQFNNH